MESIRLCGRTTNYILNLCMIRLRPNVTDLAPISAPPGLGGQSALGPDHSVSALELP